MTSTTPYHLLINSGSGTAGKTGREALERAVAESDLPIAKLEFVAPDALGDRLAEAAGGEHPVLIGGGDGTIKTCAEYMLESNKPFGVLPLGTMNLLARDAGIPPDLDAALAAYATGAREVAIDVGWAGDELFLCCAALGMLAESSEFREENRGQNDLVLLPRLTAFVFNRMDKVFQRRVELTIGKRRRRLNTAMLVISSNAFDKSGNWLMESFRRRNLRGGALAIYSAAPADNWDKVRLLMRLPTGGWGRDPVVREWQARQLVLHSGHKEELISLDGETRTVEMPLHFRIEPRALNLLVPQGDGEMS
ncbi:diacylglycerol/lipid kinase family protein [Kordiimonas aestuarii]|uniref:diacylglycerol/lipid kinase family protein n=1 Tax=Kordiimonas aestuarii TaxID=1005925 RepID=UPI0021D0BB89|nr:diacylglycerol kinase family protein [Kordiimonas aestuarii]